MDAALSTSTRYFGELTRRQAEALAELYRLDLQLFGYTAEEYIDMVRAEEVSEKPVGRAKNRIKGALRKKKQKKKKGNPNKTLH